MIQLDAEKTAAALPWVELIDALDDGFRQGCTAPLRHLHQFDIPQENSGSLILMPAWISGKYLGVKQVLVIPGNQFRNRPAVTSSYQLYSAVDGELLALIDGEQLTNRRTAAASALAARYLAREDAQHLLMVGCGSLARHLIQAHVAVRPIKQITVWGRHRQRAETMAQEIAQTGAEIEVVESLAACAGEADVISCATLAESPLLKGEWLKPGCHVDLVGAFRPSMRESDDELMRRAKIFVDTREGALEEAGDIIQPLQAGIIDMQDIVADLYELTRGTQAGRQSADEITVFKSVGTALEDLTAAILAYQSSLG